MDWHTALAVVTVASMLIGAVVELLYKPARQRDVEQLRNEMRGQTDTFFDEVRDLREEMRVRLAVLEAKKPPESGPSG